VEEKDEEGRVNDDVHILGLNVQGDGANVSSQSSQVQLTFSILNEGREVLKPHRHYCFAIMDGGEDYDKMKHTMGGVLKDVDALEGTVHEIDGIKYKIELYLSGDWKFLRTVLGVSGPNRFYFCPWCLCNKQQIADPGKSWKICRSHAEYLELGADRNGGQPASGVGDDETEEKGFFLVLFHVNLASLSSSSSLFFSM
jgi:hypothetical protein